MSIAHLALCALTAAFSPTQEPATPQDPFAAWATAALAREGLNPWKREAITAALSRPYTIRRATFTSYCAVCHDYYPDVTCKGEGLRAYCAAADPAHWRIARSSLRKAVVWVDIPAGWGGPRLLTLNDVGGAIKGRDRFDLCQGMVGSCSCNDWGKRGVRYVVLRGER